MNAWCEGSRRAEGNWRNFASASGHRRTSQSVGAHFTIWQTPPRKVSRLLLTKSQISLSCDKVDSAQSCYWSAVITRRGCMHTCPTFSSSQRLLTLPMNYWSSTRKINKVAHSFTAYYILQIAGRVVGRGPLPSEEMLNKPRLQRKCIGARHSSIILYRFFCDDENQTHWPDGFRYCSTIKFVF